MKLLTKEIEKKLPAIGATDGKPKAGRQIICKFFTPDSNFTWYVLEGQKEEDGDYLFYGVVDGFDKELGYFTLRQLESVRGALGLPIERDLHFTGTLADVYNY